MIRQNDVSTRLILVRHGRTTWNEEGKIQGWTDVPLDNDGERQMAITVKRLASLIPDFLYSSDLCRCRVPAQSAADLLGLPLRIDANLRERDFGKWAGTSPSHLLGVEREAYEAWVAATADSMADTLAGDCGESRQGFTERVQATVGALSQRHPGTTVAVFTHSGWINNIVRRLSGDGTSRTVSTARNGSLTTITAFADHSVRLDAFNDIGHLSD